MSNRGANLKNLARIFTWVLIASGFMPATQRLAGAQAGEQQPDEIRINHDVQVEDWRVLDIFSYLLRGTGLHGGFVEIAVCRDLPKGRLHIEPGFTVRQAMDALVAANPGYQWELKDGVVNLMPKGSAPLLDTRIAKFQMEATDRELPIFFQDLLRLPVVQAREAALGVKEGPGQVGLSGGQEHPVPRQPVPIQINVQNLSLQDAFNKIVQASPKGVWIYHETDCNGAKTFIVEVASDY
jgi:hypothetical protein